MSRRYVVEKILQVVITEDDLTDEETELTEALALEISHDIDTYEWQEINRAVVEG